jgi:hypothetical protein
VNRVPRWRVALGIAVLGGMAYLLASFAPIYFRNLELQHYVSDLTHSSASSQQSDDLLRTRVLTRARQLDLPVMEDNVRIVHSQDGMRIDVRYFVRVDLPGYTVDLHFYPGAGSQ